jgi:hypothetical protein
MASPPLPVELLVPVPAMVETHEWDPREGMNEVGLNVGEEANTKGRCERHNRMVTIRKAYIPRFFSVIWRESVNINVLFSIKGSK